MSEQLEEAEIREKALTPGWYWRKQIAELEATKTRWVLCSERMPEDEDVYAVMYISLHPLRAPTGPLLGVNYFDPSGWELPHAKIVLAWLENLPEYVPEAKP